MLRRMFIAFGVMLALAATLAAPALAQNTTGLVLTTCGSPVVAFKANNPGPFTVNAAGQLCITGSISASLGGFNAESFLAPFTATTGGVASGSFTAGKTIVVSNAGTTNTAYCKLGAASTTSGQPILPGSWFAFTSVAETQVTCATSTSTTTVNVAVGTGLPTGAGGGGGSGGGGAITAASGSYAAGALSAGSVASGAMVDIGSQADAACSTDNGSCSAIALIKRGNQNLTSYGSKPLDNSSVAINVSTATTTQLVALSGATLIYVTSYDVVAGGTGNITFVYGTGSNCVTGTTSLTGPYNLTAQAGISKGSGIGTILKVPAGNALCVTTSAAVQMSGSVSYQQF